MAAEFDETALRADVAGWFPDLITTPLRPVASGWDSVAYDLGGRLIVKRPRNPAAEARLRREAEVLAMVRPQVSLPVPELHLIEAPLVSWHLALPGEYLETAGCLALTEPAKDRLAATLGRFYAELHRVEVPFAVRAEAWRPAEEILAKALPVLPEALCAPAKRLIVAYAALPPDPLGEVFGHFDGHGWNMAFDHGAGRLNGVYDFADAGIGPRHREFIYVGLTSLDLMERVLGAYRTVTALAVDMRRVALLSGAHRLWELGEGAVADRQGLVRRFGDWVEWGKMGKAG